MPGVAHDLLVWDAVPVAVVTKPARIPCGVTGSSSVPLIPAAARRIRICRTASGWRRRLPTVRHWITRRKIGPSVMSAGRNHVCSAWTGQVSAWLPRAIPISAPSPAVSVLERGMGVR